ETEEVLVAGDCGAPQRDIEGELAFAGHGQAGEIGNVRGKIAMVLPGAPANLPSSRRALASSNEEKLKRLRAAGAVAEIVLTTPEVEARRPWALLRRSLANGQAYEQDDLPPLPVAYAGVDQSETLRRRVGSRPPLGITAPPRQLPS